MFKVLILVTISFSTCQCGLPKNVCSTFTDYLITPFSPNCWHNPDVGSTPNAIANRYGYSFESHHVVTDDGYKLGLFRIPARNKCCKGSHVVFLQHGILETAMSWLSLGKQSLAFKLSDAGFDVWLGNFRGTIYSNEHELSNISNDKYWDFSFFELGYYDLPAMLEIITKITKTKKKIIYLGHSLGTTVSYIYAITRRAEAHQRLAALISLAPVAYMKHTHSGFKLLASLGNLSKLLKFVNIFALGISTTRGQSLFYQLCLYGPTKNLCRFIARILFVLIFNPLSPEMLPMVLTQAPAATSLKVLQHFAQEILHGGQFQAYDYGIFNRKVYRSGEPPIYNVSRIDVPVYLLYGKKDKIADERDVKMLYSKLRTNKFLIAIGENGEVEFDHTDFIFGKNMEYLYVPIFRIMKNLTAINRRSGNSLS